MTFQVMDAKVVTQNKGYANEHLMLVITAIDVPHTFEWEVLHQNGTETIYFGLSYDGFCQGFVHDTKRQSGYGGAIFPLENLGIEIKGPWSGRPGVYHHYGAPFHMEVEVNGQMIGMRLFQINRILSQFNLDYRVRQDIDTFNRNNETRFEIAEGR